MNIQEKIDAATPNSIVSVPSGTYREALIICKSLALRGLDTGGGLPIIESESACAVEVNADSVTIEGFQVSNNGDYGIQITNSDNSAISGNIICNSRYGISLENTDNVAITGNRINDTTIGIEIINSKANITGNEIRDNRCGMSYDSSISNSIIEDNIFVGNDYDRCPRGGIGELIT